MSNFRDTIVKIYEEKKDLKNPPEYLKIIEELINLEM